MIRSMTGYGKAEAELPEGKLTIEIRTINAKGADISIKSSLLPREKDLSVRQRMAERLVRGTIDLFLTFENGGAAVSRKIDAAAVKDYYSQVRALRDELGVDDKDLLPAVLRLPDVVVAPKGDLLGGDNWPIVDKAIDEAIAAADAYRLREGEALYRDVTSRLKNILELENEVEAHEAERIDAVRARILKAAEELGVKMDKERFEQEMIFYLEKYDINEEKVRLRQHCAYFMETIDGEPYPGKKLGFIIQEMGREINTTGSKANNASIQQIVVRMKDELEKIREQSMNIL